MVQHNHVWKITEIAAWTWTSSFRTFDLWRHGVTMGIEKANIKISSEYIKGALKRTVNLLTICVFWVESSTVLAQPLECWPCRVLLRGCFMAYIWPGWWSINIHLRAWVHCMFKTSLIFLCTFNEFVLQFPGLKHVFNPIFHFLAGLLLCFFVLSEALCSSLVRFCASTWRS